MQNPHYSKPVLHLSNNKTEAQTSTGPPETPTTMMKLVLRSDQHNNNKYILSVSHCSKHIYLTLTTTL